jgi:hypothetical protein
VRHILDLFTVQRGPGGLRFWGPRLVLPERLQSLLLTLSRPEGGDVEVLKNSPRRSVFRVRHPTPDLASLIVKGFPLAKLESRVKYRKYGLAEFGNSLEVARRRLPAPECFGYFEIRAFGLVKANGLLLEDLAGWRSLGELTKAQPQNRKRMLMRVIPLMKQMYESGVNHVDISMSNLLSSPDGGSLRIIDWQYCSFVASRLPAQLLLQGCHFLNGAGVEAGSAEAEEWLEQLRQATGCPLPAAAFLRAAASLQARKKITATERLELRLDAATQAFLAEAGPGNGG